MTENTHLHHNGDDGEAFWREHSRVILSPTAPPSILGLFGFAAATFIVGGYEADWFGDSNSLIYIAPFALFFGGLAQLAAGLFAYRAGTRALTAPPS